jgi:hypothetical protein
MGRRNERRGRKEGKRRRGKGSGGEKKGEGGFSLAWLGEEGGSGERTFVAQPRLEHLPVQEEESRHLQSRPRVGQDEA